MNEPRKRTRRPRQSLVEDLSQAVRAEYINQRRMWRSLSGSHPNYLPGKQWDEGRRLESGRYSLPVWPKIAQFLIDHEILDYPEFIRRIFESRGPHRPVPQPNHLHGPVALALWKEVIPKKELRARVRQAWEQEKKAFAIAALDQQDFFPESSEQECLRSVIVNDTVNLSPLYRYCVATGEGLPRHAGMYKTLALRQYCLAPSLYDEVWGGWIPEHLKKEAEAARLSLPEDY